MEWQSTPVFLPGKPHRQRSLASYRPWGCKELHMTEWLTLLLLCFIDYAKAFDCVDHVDHNNLWEIPKREGNTRPPYLSPEKPVCKSSSNRTGHGTTDWFQIGKGGCQGYILSPCFFNFYIESIIQNAGPDEVQTGINIAGRHINNLRYADDTTPL